MVKKLLKPVGKVPYPPEQASPEVPSPNPKEGRTLWHGRNTPYPDCSAGLDYPFDYPKEADGEIERSIFGVNENEKTFGQDHLDEKKGD